MTPIAALAFVGILAALALLQVLLILGLPLGRFAWGGQQDVLSPRRRAAAGLAILIYALMAVIALARAHVITVPVPDLAVTIAMWVVAAYLVLSILPNLASKSVSEKRLMTPVSVVLAVLGLVIAIGL